MRISILLVLCYLMFALGVKAQDVDSVTATNQDTVVLDSTMILSPKLKELFTQRHTDKRNSILHAEIAEEYLKVNRIDYALKFYDQAISLDSSNIEIIYEKGQLLHRLKRNKEAYKAFLMVMRDFKGEAYASRIGGYLFSKYKVERFTNNSYNDIMPSFSPDGLTILFQSDRSGNWDIHKMDAYGGESSVMQLTSDPAADENATFSPDGLNITFTSSRDDRTGRKFTSREVYIMNADGTNPRILTSSFGSDNWSPSFLDTLSLVFASDRADFSYNPFWEKRASLYTVEKSGKFLFKIYGDSIYSYTDPAPGPKGEVLYYASDRSGNYEIYMGNTAGTDKNFQNLSNDRRDDLQPSVAGNGLLVAFASNRKGNFDIYKMLNDGTNVEQITIDKGEDLFPKISADGSKIVFCSNRTGNYQIYIATIEESAKPSVSDIISELQKRLSQF